MNIFKGYVRTKNKQCLNSFKNNENLFSYDEIKKYTEFAGVLDSETVLIDIDDFNESEILFNIVKKLNLKCKVYKTTRGKHFYFKNTDLDKNKIHTKLAVGITADIKLGCKNSYSILRFENVDREILQDINESDIQEIPKFLYPVKTDLDFVKMTEGDGRNQSLFNYILTLQNYDFTVEEIRETIKLINKFVLVKPLKDSEIDTILRDEAFTGTPSFFKGNQFLLDKFANYLKVNHHVIKLNGTLHIYKNGIYNQCYSELEKVMISVIPNLTKTRRKEVLSYLELIANELKESDSNLIAFKNGIYDITTNELMDFNPEIVLTNMIPHNYNPGAESELVDDTLMKLACNDEEIFSLLCECVGYCFLRKNELGKSFLLNGSGANGKSTFIDMIKTVLGDVNISSLDLSDLGDRFKTSEIYSKLANLGDDIGEEFIANLSVFKKLVTGDRITVERKGQDPFQFNNYAKLIFSANTIPRMRDKTGAIQRRLIIIPFNAKFTKDDPGYKPFIKYELRQQESIERLIVLAIEGLKRVLENNAFSNSSKVNEALKEYEIENNSIINFVSDIGLDNILNERNEVIYSKYCDFCIENGLKESFSKISFLKQLYTKYNLKSKITLINKKQYRIIIKGE